MTWWTIANGNVVDNSDFNDNLDHVFAGSRLPLGSAGAAFDSTDSTYDLAEDANRIRTLYCNDILVDASYTTADGSLWILEAKVEITTTALSIEFTGLNGDSSSEFMLIGRNVGAPGTVNSLLMYLNNDNGTNYARQTIVGNSNFVTAQRVTSTSMILSAGFKSSTTTELAYGVGILYSKTGSERTFINNYIRGAGETHVYSNISASFIWNNTADTITSIKFLGNTYYAGTTVYLFSRK